MLGHRDTCTLECGVMCTGAGEGNWLGSCLRQYGALTNSSITAVFSFRLSTAAEDKVKKSWRGRERERENTKLAEEKGHLKWHARGVGSGR